jgi:hypothetical protein
VIEFDASDADRLAVEIGKRAVKVAAGVYAVGTKAAVNVKNGMAADAEGIGHAPLFPDSITYDVAPAGLRTVLWRIGPDKDRPQGALGNILYFGTSKNGPVLDVGKALREETPRLERALLDLGEL